MYFPTICRPMGRLFTLPQGIVIAGRPVKLKGAVNFVNTFAIATASFPTTGGAITGTVGSTSTSYLLKNSSNRCLQSLVVLHSRYHLHSSLQQSFSNIVLTIWCCDLFCDVAASTWVIVLFDIDNSLSQSTFSSSTLKPLSCNILTASSNTLVHHLIRL